LLSGTGDNAGEPLGLLNTPGTLTRARSAEDDTALDTVRSAITDLRNGPEYVEPDLLIINPITFGQVRRLKTILGTYILGDPVEGPVSQI
jgi:HK97 family phage major capsid protein